jgi:hypothetical protein
MSDIEVLIHNSQTLTSFFGRWPSFHDGEVIDLHFWRGEIYRGEWDDRNVFPTLTMTIHILEATQVNANDAGHDVLTTLRFHDVSEIHMDGFNHQNAIMDLSITVLQRGKRPNGDDLPPYLVVQIQPAFGMSASFRCFRIEVVTAVRCDDQGKVYA